MISFCSNPKCQYHEFKVMQNQYYIYIEKDNIRSKINRHMYVDRKGNEFELCTVCHNAIEMIKSKTIET